MAHTVRAYEARSRSRRSPVMRPVANARAYEPGPARVSDCADIAVLFGRRRSSAFDIASCRYRAPYDHGSIDLGNDLGAVRLGSGLTT